MMDAVNGPDLHVVELRAADTHDLRRRVLRDGTPSDDVVFAGDDDPTTVHLGLADRAGTCVAVSTWAPRPFPTGADRAVRGAAAGHGRRPDPPAVAGPAPSSSPPGWSGPPPPAPTSCGPTPGTPRWRSTGATGSRVRRRRASSTPTDRPPAPPHPSAAAPPIARPSRFDFPFRLPATPRGGEALRRGATSTGGRHVPIDPAGRRVPPARRRAAPPRRSPRRLARAHAAPVGRSRDLDQSAGRAVPGPADRRPGPDPRRRRRAAVGGLAAAAAGRGARGRRRRRRRRPHPRRADVAGHVLRYDPERVAALQARARRTVEQLATVTSDDPAAAGAVGTARAGPPAAGAGLAPAARRRGGQRRHGDLVGHRSRRVRRVRAVVRPAAGRRCSAQLVTRHGAPLGAAMAETARAVIDDGDVDDVERPRSRPCAARAPTTRPCGRSSRSSAAPASPTS